MTYEADVAPAPLVSNRSYLEWGPVIGGAVAAAAISIILLTFGAAVGLSVTSPWPGSGAPVWVAAFAVLWWTLLVQIGSFAAGGYLAGRMRSRWADATNHESGFRDSTHGFLAWAVGILFGAMVLGIGGGAILQAGTQSAAIVAAGTASGNADASALSPTDYAVDLLLRPAPNTQGAPPVGTNATPTDDSALRAEAGRIFAATIRNREFTESDRSYLTQVVETRTGLPEADAQARVDAAVNEARDLEIQVRDAADKARKATLIAGFIAAAGLLLSAAAATAAAGVGGRHRDEGKYVKFFGHHFW